MKTIKMPGHEYANCCIREYRKKDGDAGDFDILQSYKTDVLAFDYETGWIDCVALYSKTTIKHISWYARLKNTSYYSIKRCVTDNKRFNRYTGEFADRA